MIKTTPEQIDSLLPQTQCGLCGYGGCMPYAEALLYEQAPLNLCPPGGVKTMRALGNLLQQDISAFIPEMEQKAKPNLIAVIRETECIGCTKCIQACPVDAIVGSAKQMHSIITAECTGCELCVPPCPVDCIDILVQTQNQTEEKELEKRNLARERFNKRQKRLANENKEKQSLKAQETVMTKKNYIQEALARAKEKKRIVGEK